jgi:Na+/H+ antiporter NhaD/arsenite permease-like protein
MNIFCFLFLFGLFEGKEEEEEEEEIKINTCLMCVCVCVLLLCVAFLISPIHSGPERRREMPRALYSHALLYIYTRHHLICIAKFRRDFIKTPWASEEGGEKKEGKKTHGT